MKSPHTHINLFVEEICSLFFCFRFLAFWLFRATLVAHGGSQARGWMRATAAGLCHSHSNLGSKPHLQPTPQLTATWILNPLSEAGIEPASSRMLVGFVNRWATAATLKHVHFWSYSIQAFLPSLRPTWPTWCPLRVLFLFLFLFVCLFFVWKFLDQNQNCSTAATWEAGVRTPDP